MQIGLFDSTDGLTLSPSASLEESLARICRLLESGEASQLQEAVYSLRQCESFGLQDPVILSLKTSKDFFPATKDETGLPSYERLPTLGMMVNGNYLIQGGFCPMIESGFTLLDIVEENPDLKYFLSKRAIKSLLERTKRAAQKGWGWRGASMPIITRDRTENEPT